MEFIGFCQAVCLRFYSGSKLKVFMLSRTILKLSYDKARYFPQCFWCSNSCLLQIDIGKRSSYFKYTEDQVHFFLKVAKLWPILS